MASNRYAQILALAVGRPDDATAITVAADLAQRNACLARVMIAMPDPALMVSDWGSLGGVYLAPEVIEDLAEADTRARTGIRAVAEKIAAAHGLAWGGASANARMVVEEGPPMPLLSLRHALPLADLVLVAGGEAGGPGGWARGPFAEALMTERAPALVLRSAELPTGGVVAIAWDGSLEAGRAVRAARPLLAEAQQIVILQDPSELSPEDRLAAHPDRLADYLRLCVDADLRTVHVAGGREGHALVAAAGREHAKLLVAGAYGHSRTGEWLFGGATRAFLEAHDGPHLLLAH
jgi:nucleotide-binding universal stress UspA family protein